MDGYMERKMAEGSQNRENGKETVRFFSPHEYEYMTVTVENGFRNGPAVLYEHGFKKLEWTFKDGKRSGLFTVFKRGMRLFSGWWNEDGVWDSRYLVQYTPESIVFNQYHPTTGNLVYTGGMGDNPRVREGWGLTFDPVSGHSSTVCSRATAWFAVTSALKMMTCSRHPTKTTRASSAVPPKRRSTACEAP